MRPPSTINCPPQPSQAQSLHPVLKDALSSLDVQLEEELTRYRRQRALGKSGYSPRKAAAKAAAKALQPPAIALNSPITNPQPAKVTNRAEGPQQGAGIAPEASEQGSTASKSYLELKELAKHYASHLDQEAELAAASPDGPEEYLESSEALLRSLAAEEAKVEAEQGFLRSLSTPLGIGAMLLLLLSSVMFGFVLMNPSSLSQWFGKKEPQVATNSLDPTNPPGAEVPANPTAPQPNLANQEFPDLNLSTLGSLTDGAPAVKSGLSAGANGMNKKTQKANPGASGDRSGAAKTPVQSAATSPSGLGRSQSIEEPTPPAGDMPSPRRLAPAPDYNPAPPRTYTPPSGQSNTAPSARSPQPRSSSTKPSSPTKSQTPAKNSKTTSPPPYVPPIEPAPEPSPAASVSPPPAVNSPSPSPVPSASVSPGAAVPNGYKVGFPYTSDRALEKAREKVPDAYLQNYSDGAKVQMGTYDTEAAAKKRAEELRQQGIPAEVYKP